MSVLDAIFEAYLAAQRRRRSSALTIKATTHALRSMQRWLDEHGIEPSRLTLLQCELYFDELLERQALATVRRHLAYVRAAYAYGVRHDLVERDPTVDVRLPWLPDIEPATYSTRELKAIHAAIRSEREEVAFFLFAFAGLRLGEVAGLQWPQVDFDRWQIRLTGSAAVDIDAPSHAFRRTVATVMYEQHVRTRVIERIMGWAPRQMHERHYLRVADEPMHQAIRTLYAQDPICDRQRQALQPIAVLAPDITPAGWLAGETAKLEEIEQRLRAQTG